jgi:aquaporin Z
MNRALSEHWPEYLCEATTLGIFMIFAGAFAVLFEYPGSSVHRAIADPFLLRIFFGIAMGLTSVGLVFSPLGKRSGAHMNPAVTLTFLRLGKMNPWDAFFYIIAQFIGGVTGVFVVGFFIGQALAYPSVHYAVTAPGAAGDWVAFAAEFIIAFFLMLVVLLVSNTPVLARWTGIFAGGLVAIYITFEAPLSGMSMNPARTLGSAAAASFWAGLWIYFTAPVLAMQLAAELYVRSKRVVYCAKFHHHNNSRCIFNCGFKQLLDQESS